jgi:hypothetical protein
MILHLEPKKPVADTIANAIGVHVRSVDFIEVKGRLYRNKLVVTMDPDLHPDALKVLSEIIIMQKMRMYEFVGLEASTQPTTDPVSSKATYETVIRALFINKK